MIECKLTEIPNVELCRPPLSSWRYAAGDTITITFQRDPDGSGKAIETWKENWRVVEGGSYLEAIVQRV